MQRTYHIGAFVTVNRDRMYMSVTVQASSEAEAAELGFRRFRNDRVVVTCTLVESKPHTFTRNAAGELKLERVGK